MLRNSRRLYAAGTRGVSSAVWAGGVSVEQRERAEERRSRRSRRMIAVDLVVLAGRRFGVRRSFAALVPRLLPEHALSCRLPPALLRVILKKRGRSLEDIGHPGRSPGARRRETKAAKDR